ncbi:MAG: LacI family DNA-binding transcriptional regulator [Kiritimatiellia bacterium]
MVTLKHIAEQAGVTVSVVSRALNARPDKPARVAPETKRRIEDVARALGFRRNRAAEFLKRGKSPVIQVCLPPRANERTADPVMGIADAAESEDFSLGFFSGAIVGTNSNRLSGFAQASGQPSLTARVFQVSQSAELLSWIRQSAGPVGVFAVTDLLALKLIA